MRRNLPPVKPGANIRPRSVSPTPNSQNNNNNNNTRSAIAPYNTAAAAAGGLRTRNATRANHVMSSTSPVPSKRNMNTNNNKAGGMMMRTAANNNKHSSTSRQGSSSQQQQQQPREPPVPTEIVERINEAITLEKELLRKAEEMLPEVEEQVEKAIEQRDFELERVVVASRKRIDQLVRDIQEEDRRIDAAEAVLEHDTSEKERLEEDVVLVQARIDETLGEVMENANRRNEIRNDTLKKKNDMKKQEEKSLQESLMKEQNANDDTTGMTEEGKKFLLGARKFYQQRDQCHEDAAGLEMKRRELFSLYEELKGTIRVYCRVKGVQSSDELEEVNRFLTFPDGVKENNSNNNNVNSNNNSKAQQQQQQQKITNNNDASSTTGGRTVEITSTRDNATSTGKRDTQTTFSYDRVFGISTTQSQVFDETAGLVDCAVDGYKVCIFAYGQTGSGKTFTMEGKEQNPGLIPRAINRVFDRVKALDEDGWKYEVKCSFVEIYNEQIRNLLESRQEYHRSFFDNNGNGANGKPLHEIQHHGKTDTTVSNISEIVVENPAQVLRLLKIAQNNRSVAATKMNDRSSRSHCVFTMRIEGHSDKINNGTNTTGILCLVDLAGSERIKASGAQGQQLKEAIAINQSLTHLGTCINAMGKNEKPSWRERTLTFMLKNYLSGDGAKMLMVVNISNREEHVQESINSLNFAAKVNVTQIGQAKRRVT